MSTEGSEQNVQGSATEAGSQTSSAANEQQTADQSQQQTQKQTDVITMTPEEKAEYLAMKKFMEQDQAAKERLQQQQAQERAVQKEQLEWNATVSQAEHDIETREELIASDKTSPADKAQARRDIRAIKHYLAVNGVRKEIGPQLAHYMESGFENLSKRLKTEILNEIGKLVGDEIFDKKIEAEPTLVDVKEYKGEILQMLKDGVPAHKAVNYVRRIKKMQDDRVEKRRQAMESSAGGRYHLEAAEGSSGVSDKSRFAEAEKKLEKIMNNPNATLADLESVLR